MHGARAIPLGLLVLLVGCAGVPKSSRLTVGDFEATASELAAKLEASDLLSDRTPDSPRWTIAIDKVENLSSDVISESEQWWLVYGVRDAQPMRALRETRNVVWVIPAEQLAMLRTSGYDVAQSGSERSPTHTMSGTFRSATRTASLDRTDVYRCEFRITDLATGEQVWADSVEFKRIARGKAWD